MKAVLASTAFAFGLILTACVTINIYFPAAAAEKAADKIIDEVWQMKTKNEQASEGEANTAE